jgi:hypothetical protein
VALFILMAPSLGLLTFVGRSLLATIRVLPRPPLLGLHRQIAYGSVAAGVLGLGFVLGSSLGRGAHGAAGQLLATIAALAGVVIGLAVIMLPFLEPRTSRNLGSGISLGGILLTFMVMGAFVAATPTAASAVVVAALAAPLWHWVFFLVTRPMLDRCIEGAGLGARDAGASGSRALSAARATALLPLGGLAVPWWLRLRDGL